MTAFCNQIRMLYFSLEMERPFIVQKIKLYDHEIFLLVLHYNKYNRIILNYCKLGALSVKELQKLQKFARHMTLFYELKVDAPF